MTESEINQMIIKIIEESFKKHNSLTLHQALLYYNICEKEGVEINTDIRNYIANC